MREKSTAKCQCVNMCALLRQKLKCACSHLGIRHTSLIPRLVFVSTHQRHCCATDVAVKTALYLDSLVLMRNWLETPGWSTSWIALAKMAARISRSVNTACKKRTKHRGAEGLGHQIVGQKYLCKWEPLIWAGVWLKLIAEAWWCARVSRSIGFVCAATYASPQGRGWIAARELTGWRQQHECCYGRPHRHGNGLLRSSGTL